MNGPRLQAANGSAIQSYGHVFLTISLGGRKFSGQFVRAKVQRPLLGADFLLRNNLLVDLPRRRLIHADDLSTVAGAIWEADANNPLGIAAAIDDSDVYLSLLRQFPEITQANFSISSRKHGVMHHIPTQGPLFGHAPLSGPKQTECSKARVRPSPTAWYRPSSSPWASPLHMVKKRTVSDARVAIIDVSSCLLSLIVTLYPIFRIFLHS